VAHPGLERLVGPLLFLLGLNQLLLVLRRAGHGRQPAGATLLRSAIGAVFGLSALEGAVREAGKLAARFQLLTEHSVQGVVVTDGKRILYANPAVRQIYGMPLGLGNYVVFADLPPESFSDEMLQHQHRQLQKRQVDIANWEGRREVAGGRELELRFEAWRVEWDGVAATQILITDDTERNASARELVHQATHDKLTGLPNRTVLMQRLKEYCYLADGSLQCTLVVVNIDRFKLFNQSQGHVAGDHVLKAFAAKFKDVLGARAELIRLGGDEFAIVDPDASNARDIAGRLLQRLRAGAQGGAGRRILHRRLDGHGGVPRPRRQRRSLLRAANAAMYQAKRTPGTALAMAEQRFEQMSDQSLENEQALRKGIKNQEIYLDYQPKIDAVSGKLLGFEALARWLRPGVGMVSPVEFIAIAERTGLIPSWARCCWSGPAARSPLARRLGDCVPVAVNVSPMQLLNRGFPQLVERIIADTGIPAHCLTLEITESAAVDNLDDTQVQLQHLSGLGIDVAMDDFGTGFSSLSMLRKLPLSTLKIDRGLIDPLPAPDAVAVVTAICQLATALNGCRWWPRASKRWSRRSPRATPAATSCKASSTRGR
jgi:diguanylate cyclase (GGDEF)-like protein/PAS domain S-box-containing protein